MSDHDSARVALGAYVLGSLDPAERATVDAHLRGCASCRDELASFAALPGLMGRLSATEVQAEDMGPPGSLLPRTLAAVEAERAAGRDRLRRWRGAALGVSALAAAAGLTAALVLPGVLTPPSTAPRSPVTGRPLVAAQVGATGVPAAGVLALEGRPWGTQVHLTLRDLPREGSFTAWAIDAQGSRTPAATWRATGNGRADVTGAAALDPGAVSGLEIMSSDGRRVLRTAT